MKGGDLFARLIFFTTATNYFFFVFRIYHHFFRHFGLFVLVFYSLRRKSAFFLFFLPVLVSHLRFSVNTVYFVLEVPFHGSFYHGVSGSVHCLLSSSMDERFCFLS